MDAFTYRCLGVLLFLVLVVKFLWDAPYLIDDYEDDKMTKNDFPPGTRVRYFTRPHQYASLGISGLVINLNATPFVTGTVIETKWQISGEQVAFRPDGWPLPEGVDPVGFMAHPTRLEVLPVEKDAIPCVLSDPCGRTLPPQEIKRLLDEKIERERNSTN